MNEPLRLMCILAHPDDESLGTGGILAKYSAEGVETHVVTATRGERGWFGKPEENPGLEALGKAREGELRAAAAALGVHEVHLLDYIDGDLDKADPLEATDEIVSLLRKVRPQVVVTFDPHGAYGHPDHIAICQLTTAATVCAADPEYRNGGDPKTHRVAKLYYMVDREELFHVYQSVFGELVMHVDGEERRPVEWKKWAITTWVDTLAHWRTVWNAVLCHQTQLPGYSALGELPEKDQELLWGTQTYYRAYSVVNGGRQPERDLFEGLR